MRVAQRNKRQLWFCLYCGEEEIVDSNGDFTGETRRIYAAPQRILANVSPAKGSVSIEVFGNDDSYDRVVALAWDDFATLFSPQNYNGVWAENDQFIAINGINDSTVWFIDKAPTGNSADGYDYITSRIAKSINGLMVAVRKVNSGADNG